MSPTISVIIPSYKPGEYIWQCLNSLVAQTLPKKQFEIILVLNGCCEPWKSQIQDYIGSKMQGMDVKFIQTDTPGVSNARNIALDSAQGEYITFIDDDDYVSPKYLEDLLHAASPDVVSVADSCAFIENTGEKLTGYTPHLTYQRCLSQKTKQLTLLHARAIFNGPCMKLLHRSFIQGIRFDTTLTIGEDSVYMFEISKNIHSISLAATSAIYYRRYRTGSAVMTERPASYWLTNTWKCAGRYCRIFLASPFQYNFRYFIRILLSNFYGMFSHLRNRS